MPKIVIADDDAVFLQIYTKVIEAAGYAVTQAHDGEEAIEEIKRVRPQVVVLDIMMPKKDGLQVLKEIRSEEWGKTLPVILLTAQDVDNERLAAIDTWEPKYYLVKGDSTTDDLLEKIKELVPSRLA